MSPQILISIEVLLDIVKKKKSEECHIIQIGENNILSTSFCKHGKNVEIFYSDDGI